MPILYHPPKATDYNLSSWALVQDYRFGASRPDATVRNKSDLDLVGACRYIYGGYSVPPRFPYSPSGPGCDGLYGNYSSRHTDTPEGDPASLHRFLPHCMLLRAWNLGPKPVKGSVLTQTSPTPGAWGTGTLSGIWRAYTPIPADAFFIRVLLKVASGDWSWDAFWLQNGTEAYSPGPQRGTVSPLPYTDEFDVQDGFGYPTTKPGTLLRPDVASGGSTMLWQNPAWAENPGWDYQPPNYSPGWLADGFHEIAIMRACGVNTYFCDGVAYRQDLAPWKPDPSGALHLILSNQIGPYFNSPPNPIPEGLWGFAIADAQVYWPSGAPLPPNPGKLNPAPGTSPWTSAATPPWSIPAAPWNPPAILKAGLGSVAGMKLGAQNPSTYAKPSP